MMPLNPLTAEDAQQVVFQGEVKARGAGVALAAGPAAQLVVDAAALVAFGAQDVEAAQFGDALSQLDVGAAAGHVGGDGHGAGLTGIADDLGLGLVVLGVEHVVFDAAFFEDAGDLLGHIDGDGAHQHRLAFFVELDDLVQGGLVFFLAGLVDDVGKVGADHGFVGGHHADTPDRRSS
jgi:hypothetical protein